ncbi:DNA repair protein [Streptomyces abyssalis]|uniref:DNA repair protein n=1 Tax=Streptomyces abyssalis TaxID=933944 RepID=A0A1E7JNU0_9ACTN|nr:DUF488 domain-containing protein [Streptomyces abyssalis]OEU86699.1 DNA repair protein [Streptomyces abyssalis]OEU89914.1 DNA repair protein [Streptomyces abyssalis]
MTTAAPLVTFGHGTATRDQLTALLDGAGVAAVVDVRTAPGSRRNPDARREQLTEWMPRAGLEYRWEKRLGGFRKPAPDSPDVFWEHEQFRGYAGWTRDPGFLDAVDELLDQAARLERTAVMCAESLWWRCHRRIIADFAVLARDTPVLHLAHDGRLTQHPLAPGARLRDDGLLVYDKL